MVREAAKIILDTPGVDARGAVRRLRRCHLHQRAQCRRDLLGAGAVRGTGRAGLERADDPAGPERAARRHPGGVHHHHHAAAGARHRHRRRLQDDGRGPARARRCGPRCGHPGDRRRRQPAARSRRRLLGVQHPHAENLCRHRPGARRDAGRDARARVRGARGVSGLVLHQRLQLPGPDLPGPHAGRRRVPAESARCRRT